MSVPNRFIKPGNDHTTNPVQDRNTEDYDENGKRLKAIQIFADGTVKIFGFNEDGEQYLIEECLIQNI